MNTPLPPPPPPSSLRALQFFAFFLLKRFHNGSAQQLCQCPFCILQANHFCQPCTVFLPGISTMLQRQILDKNAVQSISNGDKKILIGFICKTQHFLTILLFVHLVQKPVLYLPPLVSPRIRAGSHLPWGHHTTRSFKPGFRSVGPITSQSKLVR